MTKFPKRSMGHDNRKHVIDNIVIDIDTIFINGSISRIVMIIIPVGLIVIITIIIALSLLTFTEKSHTNKIGSLVYISYIIYI